MSLALALSLALSQAPAQAVSAPPVEDPNAHEAAPASKPPEPAPNDARAPLPPAPAPEQPWWQRVTLTGFARVGVFYTLPAQEEQLVGGNGGFRIADFRLNLDFKPIDKLWVSTSVELAAPLVDPADPLTGRRVVDLRDAFVQYDLASFLQVRAGQFRPPYYAEMLQSDGAIPFVSRSVLAGGLHPPEAYPKNALAPDRQVGVQLSSARLGTDVIGFRYALGVFNGNGLNQLFNDNNSVVPVGRIEVDVFKAVTLGLNGYYNQRADGARPNRVTSNQLAYGADLSASFLGFTLLGAVLGKSITYSYAGLPADSQLGALGQLRYFHEATGLEAAARFAWYEPSSAQTADQVTEIAGMVGWRPFKLPFRVLVQYTRRGEETGAAYDNDSVDAMLHAVW
jgi:hypothetical protein